MPLADGAGNMLLRARRLRRAAARQADPATPAWTQSWVAQQTGIAQSTISRIERGSQAYLAAVLRLARFYDVPLYSVVRDCPDDPQ